MIRNEHSFSLEIEIGSSEMMETQQPNDDEMSNDRANPIEKLLRKDQEWLFQVVENANEIITVTQDGFIKFCNSKATHISGYSFEELTSKPFTEFIHPDDREMILEYHYRRLGGKMVPRVYTFRIVDKAEQIRWVENIGIRITWEGKPAILSFLSDITERRQTEAALRESEERIRCLSKATFEGIAITDQGKVIDANEQISRMLGYDPAEMIGTSAIDFVAPESRDVVLENITSGFEGPYEHLALRKDGTTFPVEVQAKALPYLGRIVRVTAIRDITERKQAEEKIRRRNRELVLLNRVIAASVTSSKIETILETICQELAQAFELPHAVAALLDEKKSVARVVAEYATEDHLKTLSMSIPLANGPSFQNLLNGQAPLTANDVPNDPNLAPFHELLRQRGTASLLIVPLIINGEVAGGLGLESLEPRHFSTEEVNLAWSVADQVAGVLTRVRLDAERQRWEEQYLHAQKMEAVGRLTAGIAHDFNNMLTAINGFATLIQDQLLPDDPLREMVGKILDSGQRATDLVRQLLTFSRRQIIEPQMLNLNTVVADMDKMLRRIIGEDIDLKTVLTQDLWLVKVDPNQMGQVIMNLAVNARDAMPGGGRLTIETANVVIDDHYITTHLETQPGEYVLLTISDTGYGMNYEVKSHIFEPFFTTKELGKGTGLGLATVYGIVKQSGGDIWVYSEEGIGTAFKIYLPRATESTLSPTHLGNGEEMPSGHETILIVEDHTQVRELVRQVLQRQGYILLEAQNGHEALRLIANYAGPIHLLLTDVVMPGFSGKPLAEEAAHLRPDMKILFMSGYTDETIAHHGVLEPGVAFLQKPFTPMVLARKVRVVLDS